MNRLTLFINKCLHFFEIKRVYNNRKAVFLTFDDGPEPAITEFVLDELKKHDFKATFFCRGDNAEIYPGLIQTIISEGHSIGNHTYSHLNSFETKTNDYQANVEQADAILHTPLFRPPKGSITLSAFCRLHGKYKIYYWSLMSGDSMMERFDKTKCFEQLINHTKSGDIILFHFCHRHENETRQILPDYLNWLDKNGYHSEIIK